VNRRELQALADVRLREAQVLYRARQFSGSYYLAGYALECALKACVAKKVRRYDFPDREIVNKSWTHDLKRLAIVAGIDDARVHRAGADDIFRRNWDVCTRWTEESRYGRTNKADCRLFLDAIMEENHGLLPWIEAFW
jgi:hypothetical protein